MWRVNKTHIGVSAILAVVIESYIISLIQLDFEPIKLSPSDPISLELLEEQNPIRPVFAPKDGPELSRAADTLSAPEPIAQEEGPRADNDSVPLPLAKAEPTLPKPRTQPREPTEDLAKLVEKAGDPTEEIELKPPLPVAGQASQSEPVLLSEGAIEGAAPLKSYTQTMEEELAHLEQLPPVEEPASAMEPILGGVPGSQEVEAPKTDVELDETVVVLDDAQSRSLQSQHASAVGPSVAASQWATDAADREIKGGEVTSENGIEAPSKPALRGIEEYVFILADRGVSEEKESYEKAGDVVSNLPEVEASEEGSWRRRCSDSGNLSTCQIVQEVFLQRNVEGTKHNLGRLLKVSVALKNPGDEEVAGGVPYISIHLPLGVDLRPGVVLRIDKGTEIPFQYLECNADGCRVGRLLDNSLLRAMREGSQLFVGFRPWGGGRTNVIPAPLNGFAGAFLSIQ